MKASYRWLKELVPGLPGDPQELARRFTHAGLEVESTSAYGAGTESCVVAKVVSVRPHPTKGGVIRAGRNTGGLRLVTVDRGGAAQEVVCGAPNVPEPGGLVVLAPLGAHLPAKGLTIARRDIGGVASEGMLCSEAELGLTEEAGGILVLAAGTAAPGTRLTDAIDNVQDTIFDLSLTPNRPDGLGHVGLAREAAALFGIPWTVPEPEGAPRTANEDAAALVRVDIEDGERCPHYAAAVVLGAAIGPSPLGVRCRLAALGVRPISNAVDSTNLVLMEYGHPMHAFDLDRVRGRRIVVRRAKEGEFIETLDGVVRTLALDDLVICDGEGPVALAGVMGGRSSEIGPTTRRILLECAYFEPRTVRRSSRRHGLHSESSHRFERGIDHGDTRGALARAVALTCRLSGASAARGVVYAKGRDLARAQVTLRRERMDALLGLRVPWDEAKRTLARLGFEPAVSCATATRPAMDPAATADTATFVVPTHRPDVSREADVIDEVVRVRGLDAVPASLPAIRPCDDAGPRETLLADARRAAVGAGLSEAIAFSLTSPRALAAAKAPAATVRVENPLSEEQSVLRTTLLVGLLEAVARARRFGERNVRLFSTGSVFLKSEDGALPVERPSLALVAAGDRATWLQRPEPVDVWEAKGLAESLVRALSGREVTISPAAALHLHPRGAAAINVHNTYIGTLGPLHPDVAEAFDTGSDVVVVELDLDAIGKLGKLPVRCAPIPRFPASGRDLAVVVKDEIPAGDVGQAVKEAAGPLAEHVALFDRFAGGPIPAGHVSLAFHVVYRAPDRTLTDAEVDAAHAKVTLAVGTRFCATLRA